MKKAVFLLLNIFNGFLLFSQNNYLSPKGYVPDKETAIKIAEAVWLPIYGKSVLNEKPYQAVLIGDSVWIVRGTLNKKDDTVTEHYIHMTKGGTAYIEKRKKDCKVLKVIHYK